MDEIQDILAKYDRAYLACVFASTPKTDRLALAFYEDVAEILDILSRLRNSERNPTGFSTDDASILGLLVRTWNCLLIVWIYKEHSAEYAAIAQRWLIEVAVTATYLLRSDKSTLGDYRRCSYRNRVRMLKQAASGSEYYRSKAGHRLLRSINKKLALEGLDEHSFRRPDPQPLARSGQDLSRDLQGGRRRGPGCRCVRYLLGVRPVFLARGPRLLLTRKRRPRFLAAVRAASRERRPRFSDRPVCRTALSGMGSKGPIGRSLH